LHRVGLACGGQCSCTGSFADANFLDDNDLNGYISGTIVTLFAVLIGIRDGRRVAAVHGMRDRVAAEAPTLPVSGTIASPHPRARSAVRKDMLLRQADDRRGVARDAQDGTREPQGSAYIMDATTDVGG